MTLAHRYPPKAETSNGQSETEEEPKHSVSLRAYTQLAQTLSDTVSYSQILTDTLRNLKTLKDAVRYSQILTDTLRNLQMLSDTHKYCQKHMDTLRYKCSQILSVICYIILYYIILCYIILCYNTLHYVILFYVMLCYVMLHILYTYTSITSIG